MFPVLNLSTSKSMLVSRTRSVRVLVVSSGRVLYVVSIAWAHMELTMLLKKVIVPSFHFYLVFQDGLVLSSKVFACSEFLVWLQAVKTSRQSMGPYGAHHAPEIV